MHANEIMHPMRCYKAVCYKMYGEMRYNLVL